MPTPVIDPDAIEALRSVAPDDGGKFLTELIDIFLADTPSRLNELVSATDKGDITTATRAAHSIKGSAGNFGAAILSQIALEVEHAAKAGQLDTVRARTTELERAAADAYAALSALRTP